MRLTDTELRNITDKITTESEVNIDGSIRVIAVYGQNRSEHVMTNIAYDTSHYREATIEFVIENLIHYLYAELSNTEWSELINESRQESITFEWTSWFREGYDSPYSYDDGLRTSRVQERTVSDSLERFGGMSYEMDRQIRESKYQRATMENLRRYFSTGIPDQDIGRVG